MAEGLEPDEISLRVKRTQPETEVTVRVGRQATLAAFRELLAEASGVPAPQQRLIFRGRILADSSPAGVPLTLEALGLEDGHVLHLVTRAAEVAAAGALPVHRVAQNVSLGRARARRLRAV